MMDYTIFKELVSDKFMEYMPEEFRNGKLTISRVNKINGTKDGLSIYQEGAQAAPTIYVDDMYENFKRNDNLEEVFEEAAELYVRATKEMPPIPSSSVTEGAQDKIYMVLINTESNKELLNTAPHREVNDTSVIYRIMVSDNERGLASALITNDIAGKLGMSEEDLFKVAAENTPKLFPPVVMPLSKVMAGILSEEGGVPGKVADQVADWLSRGSERMWIISNNKGVSGAVNMIFEKNLNELSKGLGDDLYILPSSIHEVIAIPASMADPEDLAEMVHQVNTEMVDVSERLSNQVYHYDRAERKLSMATDSQNRGIANAVADVGLVYDAEQKR
jgi:hypothetical protein